MKLPRPPEQEAVAGVMATALLLGASKWGSYIGRNPAFLTDLLVLVAVVHLIVTKVREPDRFSNPGASANPVLALFVGWVLLRFALTPQISVDAFRDLAPYLYAVLGVVGAASLARIGPAGRARTARILEWALYFHAAWVFVVVILFPNLYVHLPHISPGRPEYIFQPRPDIDEALSGIAAAVLLLRLFRRERVWLAATGFVACWLTIILQESRAGQLGALAATLLAASVGLLGREVSQRTKLFAFATLPVVVAVLALTLPQTTAWQRLEGTFGFGSGAASQGASGTTSARQQSWNVLYAWDTADPVRSTVGVGFGTNFMTESGAEKVLTGSEQADGPRSPHNYWLGTYSRLGVPGVALFAILVLLILIAVIRNRRRIVDDPLLALVTLVPAGLIVPASFGVVLESPFGAIPFFWAAGVMLALPRVLDTERQLADSVAGSVEFVVSDHGSRHP